MSTLQNTIIPYLLPINFNLYIKLFWIKPFHNYDFEATSLCLSQFRKKQMARGAEEMMGRVCFSTETPRNRSWRKEARLHSLRSLHVPLRPLLAEPGRTPEPEGPPGQRSEPNLQEQHGEGRRGKRRSPAPRRRASIHSKDITVSILPVDFRAGDLFHIVT